MTIFDAFLRWLNPHYIFATDGAVIAGPSAGYGRADRATLLPSPIAVLVLMSVGWMAVLLRAAGLQLEMASAALIVGLLLLSVTLPWAVAQLHWRHEAALRTGISGIALFAALSLTGASASYPLAALTSGYHDAALERIDGLLHFDWVALYMFVAAHPSLQMLGVLAYRAIYLIPVMLIGYWAVAGQTGHANRFLFEFWLGVVITLALFVFMPAAGPLAYLWHGSITYMPDSQLCQPQLILELRLETLRSVDMGHLCGLVSAPSFHAVAAVLYFGSAFRAGKMKWPVISLSVAMLAATPVEGTHYLVDILLGIAVAVVVLAAVQIAVGWSRLRVA